MKKYNQPLLFVSLFVLTLSTVKAQSCNTFENEKKTICNEYSNFKNKDPKKLTILCSMGNIKAGTKVITNKFSNDSCDPKEAIAKCNRKGKDLTFYYSGKVEDLKKGCTVFKDAKFVEL